MKTELRRGFKAEADSHAKTLREELHIAAHEPLSPWKLAEYLDIPVKPLSIYRDEIPEAVNYCSVTNPDLFSAVTICDQNRRLIIHNDTHHIYRQAANIAHEISHCLLGHVPGVVFDQYQNRHFNDEQENEANWLGPALLIPKEAAIYILKKQIDITQACVKYGVSRDLIRMRINVTGARKIMDRSLSKHR